MLSPELTSNLLLILIVFFSAVLQGVTGFGYSLIALPLLVLLLPPSIVTPFLILSSIAINIVLIYNLRTSINYKIISPLIFPAIAGTPLGIILLSAVPPYIIKFAAGIIIFFTALFLMRNYKFELKNKFLSNLIVGFSSGILNGSTSMSGPPIILLFAANNEKKDSLKGNFALFAVITNIIAIAGFILTGGINEYILKISLINLPALLGGTYLGILLAKSINEEAFRKMVLVFIMFTALFAVISSII